jgi:A/G-specific adenine glycosylase
MSLPPAAALLAWYDRHRRRLPWRAEPGERPDPYRVWLSEVMLQQTTVAAILPRFTRFLERFPTVESLAAAPIEAVMAEWAGLGYYARARNLHACARAVVEAGGFPRAVEGLRRLPGVGAYTAAAVAAIAFGVPVVPVDGNVERVAARVFAVEEPLPGARLRLARLAAELGEQAEARARPSDFAQALFDLGATICTPRAPACALCPWHDPCAARRQGIAGALPWKAPRAERPVRFGAHFWVEDEAGTVLLHRRPPRGLLGGTLALPGTAWRPEPWPEAEALAAAPGTAPWRLAGIAEHGFTHFTLRADVYAARAPALPSAMPAGDERRQAAEAEAEMPTVFAHMARLARQALRRVSRPPP